MLHFSVNGRVITDFDQTPLISTYLIAIIVSDFEYREFIATKENPTTQRVFTIKEYVNQTSYALTEAITILKAIENYLQVPFTLSKLDHASIPDTRVGGLIEFSSALSLNAIVFKANIFSM